MDAVDPRLEQNDSSATSAERGGKSRLRLSNTLRSLMGMKIGTIRSLACVGLGALLGFVAARTEITPSARADVAPRPGRQLPGGDPV